MNDFIKTILQTVIITLLYSAVVAGVISVMVGLVQYNWQIQETIECNTEYDNLQHAFFQVITDNNIKNPLVSK